MSEPRPTYRTGDRVQLVADLRYSRSVLKAGAIGTVKETGLPWFGLSVDFGVGPRLLVLPSYIQRAPRG
jgi:hypothetical protein